jgi:TonB family protein
MLEQLIESKTDGAGGENKREAGFLAVTLFAVVALLLTTMTYSLFAKEFTLDDNGLEFSALVAPVTEVAEPPRPELPKPAQQQQAAPAESNVILRKEAYESIEQSTKAPVEIGSQKDAQSWVPGAKLSKENFTPSTGSNLPTRDGNEKNGGLNLTDDSNEKDIEPPPPVTKKKIETAPPVETKKPIVVTGGVVNGKALNLVKPQYSAAAKAVRASGVVNVQVTIDEKGNIIAASAVSGHQLLRQAAEQAARSSKFSPTYLTNQAVRVTGVIVYNFQM